MKQTLLLCLLLSLISQQLTAQQTYVVSNSCLNNSTRVDLSKPVGIYNLMPMLRKEGEVTKVGKDALKFGLLTGIVFFGLYLATKPKYYVKNDDNKGREMMLVGTYLGGGVTGLGLVMFLGGSINDATVGEQQAINPPLVGIAIKL